MKVLFRRLTLLFFVLLCSASLFFHWNRIERRSQVIEPSADHTKARSLTDLYPPWLAARESLLHRRDPYGSDITREIQVAYFGKELDTSHISNLSDAQRFSLAYRFAYPLYTVLFLAPIIGMQFQTAQIVSWWFFLSATLIGACLWLRFVGVRLRGSTLVVVFAILLSSIPVMQGLKILQLGLLVAALIAGAALSAAKGHLFLAGALLALATIRPQMSLLVIAWFVLWLSAAWTQRRSLLWGFGITLAALLLASEYLRPGWLLRYPHVLAAYANYTGASSLLGLLLPPALHWPLMSGALLVASVFCWRARRQPASSSSFSIALGFALTLTVSIVPTVIPPFNHVLLIPVPLLMILHWKDLWRTNRLTRLACVIICSFGFLPWLLAFALAFVPSALQREWFLWSAPLSASLALPFVAFGSLLLMGRLASTPAVPTPHLIAIGSDRNDPTIKGLTIS
jgi:hypothetical protein